MYNNSYEYSRPHLQDELYYVRSNVDYYSRHFATDGNYKGWNFICMFFPYEWMCFRKMYLEAILSFIIVGLVSSLFVVLFNNAFLYRVFIWGLRLAFGALGNMLYWRKTSRMVRRTIGFSDEERKLYLESKGGVSIIGLIICLVAEGLFQYFMPILLAQSLS